MTQTTVEKAWDEWCRGPEAVDFYSMGAAHRGAVKDYFFRGWAARGSDLEQVRELLKQLPPADPISVKLFCLRENGSGYIHPGSTGCGFEWDRLEDAIPAMRAALPEPVSTLPERVKDLREEVTKRSYICCSYKELAKLLVEVEKALEVDSQ